MKRYCIINIAGLYEADIGDNVPLDCELLTPHCRPRVFYTDREQAEEELFRLAKIYGCNFEIFESSARVVESPVCPGALHLEDV
jgi:hypothetical protein